MKSRYTTFDLRVAICDLQSRLIGLRVVNVYDVDNKTYLIKLAKPDEKAVLLLESGIRLHSTEFEWPKNMMPSGFAMKMRKHLKSRRLEKIEQLGIDRIVDLQFGSGEAAYHIILELYDRGNIVLTDHEYLILNILRPRADESQDVRFAVREVYPLDAAKQHQGLPSDDWLRSLFSSTKVGDNLKKLLNPNLVYGPALIDHCLLSVGFPLNAQVGRDFDITKDLSRLVDALTIGENLMFNSENRESKGYIIQQKEKKPVITKDDESTELLTYSEFHPVLLKQHESLPYVECSSFDKAVDEFYSKIESQKMDVKVIQQEKTALKKLDNIKKDHMKRLEGLHQDQQVDTRKAQLIECNLTMVDRAITVIRSALANQIDWTDIQDMVNESAQQDDPVASAIKSLKLDTNHMTLLLKYPDSEGDSEDESESNTGKVLKPMKVDIDLGLSAYANARKYFDMKRQAHTKEQKTLSASEKALKSAERKTKQTLKDVRTVATINKARKTYWFEKFLWFISSENFLVIGGRDQQQNEIIVKRYLIPGDIYVHADLHGASSVIIKNNSRTGEPIPPKTLNEAGTMALCNSAAWDAKVVTSSWWVYHDQVSKTAPTGEYLTTGSFMIRGKKNYLPPSYLVYGFGFLYKVDEASVERHKNERRVRTTEDDLQSIPESVVTDSTTTADTKEEDQDLDNGEDEDDGDSSNEDEVDDKDGNTNNDGSDTDDDDGSIEDGDVNLSSIKEEEPQEKGNEPQGEGEERRDDDKADKNVNSSGSPVVESAEFPDTNIDLRLVEGDRFVSQTKSSVDQKYSVENEAEDVDVIYLGDDKPVVFGEKVKTNRMSAKQRRVIKKEKLATDSDQSENVQDLRPTNENKPKPEGKVKVVDENQQAKNQAQGPPKRGQKNKLKKIKERYGDQDEEERKIKMELLASSGQPKEVKIKKGSKAAKKLQLPRNPKTVEAAKQVKIGRLTKEDLILETPTMEATSAADGDEAKEKVPEAAEDQGDDAADDDQTLNMQVIDVLDSLTGQPTAEDILLFCLPVCAPYAAIQSYKYKVKLIPGSTKRGKAAKLAVNMFITDRNTSAREKDLFKSLKDTDLSRNMPGKVKVSSSLHNKAKHK